ncbi:MAG: hypothetical protein R3B71_00260 [Candidatus Gracilibacteria bacterium]
MKNKHKLYALLGALILVLAAVLFANMGGSQLQGYLRAPSTELRSSSEELKIRPLSIEQTFSSLDKPVEVAGFTTDRAMKIQEIDLKIAPAGFAIDSVRAYLNKTDLASSADEASLGFMTCPHCGFAKGEPLEAKIRFVKPIEVNANDVFLVEMKTKAVDSREGNLESEITGISEVLTDGSLKIHPVDNLDYVIQPSDGLREIEDSQSSIDGR